MSPIPSYPRRPKFELGGRSKCRDCAVEPGKMHGWGCPVERCALCGGQSVGCDCVYDLSGNDGDDNPTIEMWTVYDAAVEAAGGRLPWSGYYPGYEECIDRGLWTDAKGKPCGPDDNGAWPDVGRLCNESTWSIAQRKWVKGS